MKSRSVILKIAQAKMGPVSIETTAGFHHPVVAKASNPLDDLLSGLLDQSRASQPKVVY